VYLKLKDQYTDINYGSLRIGGFMSIPMMKELWVGFLKMTIKMSCMLLVQLNEDQLVRTISAVYWTIQIWIPLLSYQRYNLQEPHWPSLFEETNNMAERQIGIWLIKGTSHFRTYADFASKLVCHWSGKVRGVLTKFATDYQLVSLSERPLWRWKNDSILFWGL
jgi:hypothetical protein